MSKLTPSSDMKDVGMEIPATLPDSPVQKITGSWRMVVDYHTFN